MNRSFTLLCRVLLAAVLLAACYIFGQFWWRNHCTIRRCQDQVTEAVNRETQARWPALEEFPTIQFSTASRVLGVPQKFEIDRQQIWGRVGELPHKPVGTLTAVFDRYGGSLTMDFAFTVGGYPREAHVEVQLEPVP